MKAVTWRGLNPVGVGGRESEIDGPEPTGVRGVDVLGRPNHLDTVRNTEETEEATENGAGGADLLGWTGLFTRKQPGRAVSVTLRGIVVADKAGKAAEGRAEPEVKGVALMAKGGSEVRLGRGVDGKVDQMGVNGNGRRGGQETAEPIAIGKSERGGKSSAIHSVGEEGGPDAVIPRDDAIGGEGVVRGEIGGGGEGDRPVATGLEGDGTVETPRGKGARRRVIVGREEVVKSREGLGIVPTTGGKEEAMILERNRVATRAPNVGKEAPATEGTRGADESLASAGDAPVGGSGRGVPAVAGTEETLEAKSTIGIGGIGARYLFGFGMGLHKGGEGGKAKE